jgi:hypothetical protein
MVRFKIKLELHLEALVTGWVKSKRVAGCGGEFWEVDFKFFIV